MRGLCVIIISILISSCTLKDTVDYKYIDKAEVRLKLTFSKGDTEIDNAIVYIYDGKDSLYRIVTADRQRIDTGVYETYLYNDTYTFVTWANCGDNTIVPTDMHHLSDASMVVKSSSDVYTTADNLMYHLSTVDILKGDSKEIAVDLDMVTYKINIKIDNTAALDQPSSYYFSLRHGSSISFPTVNVTHPVTYTPELQYHNNHISGSLRVPHFGRHEPITIGIYSRSGVTLFESDIQKYLTNQLLPDLMTGKPVNIDIRIVIEETFVSIYIDDFYIATEQRVDLGQ